MGNDFILFNFLNILFIISYKLSKDTITIKFN